MHPATTQLLALLPLVGERYYLEQAPEQPTVNAHGDHTITLRTLLFDGDAEARSIQDIREQSVVWLLARHGDDSRIEAYLSGWAAALRQIFHAHGTGNLTTHAAESLEMAMPCDLVCPDVLDLRRPQTPEDFSDALLSGARRLGNFARFL